MKIEEIRELGQKLKENIRKVIVGKDEVIELVLVSLLSGGHVLLEDVPGLGKTVLAKSLAKSIGSEFKRIQFTPDLLPSDITGVNYFNPKTSEFVFRKGPIFANIVLADEINRATPRTQSSLLECMEERQVSIDGETSTLSNPFFVIATQNPVETQGTFVLPEAQMDRFNMKLSIGYPDKAQGKEILDRFQNKSPLPDLEAICTGEQVADAQRSYSSVKITDDVKNYIIDIVEKTRNHENIALGVSPRGSLALMRSAQVYAAIKGRDFVTPEDIKSLAVPVLSHRIIIKGFSAIHSKGGTPENVMKAILSEVEVPLEKI